MSECYAVDTPIGWWHVTYDLFRQDISNLVVEEDVPLMWCVWYRGTLHGGDACKVRGSDNSWKLNFEKGKIKSEGRDIGRWAEMR